MKINLPLLVSLSGFVLITISTTELQARVPLECTDLWAATCLPENRSDGTGESLSVTTASDRVQEVLEKGKKELKAKVAEFVKQPKNKYVLSLAIRHMGLPDDLCEDPKEAERCRTLAETALYEAGYKIMFDSSNPGEIRQVSLESVAPILRNASYLKFLKDTANEIINSFSVPEKSKFVADVAFDRVKTQFISLINELPISEKMRDKMLTKMANISFAGTDCSSLGKKFEPNAYYDPAVNAIYFCQGILLTNTSEFAIVQTLAHEMGHAFDPCNIGDKENGGLLEYVNDPKKSWEKQYPLPNVIQCLRQSNSVAARVIPIVNTYSTATPNGPSAPGSDSSTRFAKEHSPSKQSTPTNLPPIPPGGPQYYNPYANYYGGYTGPNNQNMGTGYPMQHPFYFNAAQCSQSDQLSEAVPDWFASNVLPKYMSTYHKNLTPSQLRAGYSNAWAWACQDQKPGKLDEHPMTKDRVNKILAMQPQVRAQMQCPPSTGGSVYCDANKPPPPPPEALNNGLYNGGIAPMKPSLPGSDAKDREESTK